MICKLIFYVIWHLTPYIDGNVSSYSFIFWVATIINCKDVLKVSKQLFTEIKS